MMSSPEGGTKALLRDGLALLGKRGDWDWGTENIIRPEPWSHMEYISLKEYPSQKIVHFLHDFQ